MSIIRMHHNKWFIIWLMQSKTLQIDKKKHHIDIWFWRLFNWILMGTFSTVDFMFSFWIVLNCVYIRNEWYRNRTVSSRIQWQIEGQLPDIFLYAWSYSFLIPFSHCSHIIGSNIRSNNVIFCKYFISFVEIKKYIIYWMYGQTWTWIQCVCTYQ